MGEKKQTEELVLFEERKKEREKKEKESIPLVWNGMEWVFEDEFIKNSKRKELEIKDEVIMKKAAIKSEEKKVNKLNISNVGAFLHTDDKSTKKRKEEITISHSQATKRSIFEDHDDKDGKQASKKKQKNEKIADDLSEIEDGNDVKRRKKVNDQFSEREKTKQLEEEKLIIKPLPELLSEKNENDDTADEMQKEKKKINDEFEERKKNKNGPEEKIIIKPKFEKGHDDAIKEEDEDVDGIDVKDRKKINDEFKER